MKTKTQKKMNLRKKKILKKIKMIMEINIEEEEMTGIEVEKSNKHEAETVLLVSMRRVRADEFYQEMIRRGFVFEERSNEAIDVPIEDEKSPLSEPQGSPSDVIMPPKSAPMTQAAIRRMIKESCCEPLILLRAWQGKRMLKELLNCEGGSRKLRVFSRSVNVPRFNDHAIEGVPRMKRPEELEVDAYIQRFNNNIKGEVEIV
ncbi:hypothetical protein Tco_1183466 [Tanacetum coccineum]